MEMLLSDKEFNDYKSMLPPSMIKEMTDDEIESKYITDECVAANDEGIMLDILSILQSSKVIRSYSVQKEDRYKVIVDIAADEEDTEEAITGVADDISLALACTVKTPVDIIYNGNKVIEGECYCEC